MSLASGDSGPCGGLRLLEEVPEQIVIDSSYTFPSVLIISQQAKNTAVNLILDSEATALKSQFNLLCREKPLSPSVTSHFLGSLPYIGVNFIIDH